MNEDKENYGDFVIRLCADECCPNPREDYDGNVSRLIGFHDEIGGDSHEWDWNHWNEDHFGSREDAVVVFQNWLDEKKENGEVLFWDRVEFYQQSGDTALFMSRTESKRNQWPYDGMDKGYWGYSIVMLDDFERMFSDICELGGEVRAKAVAFREAHSELELYSMWLDGGASGWVVEDLNGIVRDSRWGMFPAHRNESGADFRERLLSDAKGYVDGLVASNQSILTRGGTA